MFLVQLWLLSPSTQRRSLTSLDCRRAVQRDGKKGQKRGGRDGRFSVAMIFDNQSGLLERHLAFICVNRSVCVLLPNVQWSHSTAQNKEFTPNTSVIFTNALKRCSQNHGRVRLLLGWKPTKNVTKKPLFSFKRLQKRMTHLIEQFQVPLCVCLSVCAHKKGLSVPRDKQSTSFWYCTDMAR